MHRLRMTFMAGAAMLVAAAGAGAQLRASASVPAGFVPPAGMCRVWYDGIAPGRQPAPTDCGTARANLRAGSRLVYGPSLRTGDTGRNGGIWTNGQVRDDDRYGQRSERQRHEWEKARRKQEHEWEKARRKQEHEYDKERRKAEKHHGRGHHDGDDEDDDDDRDEHDGRDNRGIYRGGRDNGGIYGGGYPTTDGRTTTGGRNGGIWTRGRLPQGNGCVDANRDGICDNAQGTGRVRIP